MITRTFWWSSRHIQLEPEVKRERDVPFLKPHHTSFASYPFTSPHPVRKDSPSTRASHHPPKEEGWKSFILAHNWLTTLNCLLRKLKINLTTIKLLYFGNLESFLNTLTADNDRRTSKSNISVEHLLKHTTTMVCSI